MSLAGLKKQLNKANQYMSEKIGGAKGTELEDDFVEMERKIDVTVKLVDELMSKTQELLQPNPASRVITKFRGQSKGSVYPQPEGSLGDVMQKYGRELGDSSFGASLMDCGEAYKQMADVKNALEENVKQNFLEPLHHLQTKDLKEVIHHRKKLQSRRLDYDCKKRKQVKGETAADEEINIAEEKFEESKELAFNAMSNLLDSDVEQISQLAAFVEAELNYHQQAVDILQSISEKMQERTSQAASKPKSAYVSTRVTASKSDSNMYDNGRSDYNNSTSTGYSLSPPAYHTQQKPSEYEDTGLYVKPAEAIAPPPRPEPIVRQLSYVEPLKPDETEEGIGSDEVEGGAKRQPCCEAMFDFEPENEGELGFKEGDVIQLSSQIDENWYEGSLNGQVGFFPTNYVKVLVEL